MTLETLIAETGTKAVTGDLRSEVADICYDSRQAGPGTVFVALRGATSDGHRFIAAAVEAGCAAVVAEELPDWGGGGREGVPWIHVEDTRRALASLSATFFGHPSRDLAVAGITGTNGKTTVAFLTHHLLSATWHRCGLLGTVTYDTGLERLPAARTTPESRDLQELLAKIRDAGSLGVAMEVSSHALVQHRTDGVAFDVAVFTNLSQDHLDYHKTMDAYFASKAILFDGLADAPPTPKGRGTKPRRPTAVINIDDPYGRRLIRRLEGRAETLTYGMGVRADFRAVSARSTFDGTSYQLEARGRSFLVRTPHIGDFNVYNSLAALATCSALGVNFREAVENLADAPQVPGRMESVADNVPFRVFVDYAHTPDALEKAIATLRALDPKRLITVFGCGGDRDRSKRPLMAAAAGRGSDLCIVTSDNPRTEDPNAILQEISLGMRDHRHTLIQDRKEAIGVAIQGAAAGDIVLIAGKGHEDYQEFATETIPFDDRRVARSFVARWRSRSSDALREEIRSESPDPDPDPDRDSDPGERPRWEVRE
ncbi:UDP-N-acetylmuramoyl-L-alanyl-D-glutamate--2,6-diaminopimelate ligase [soil metagenome]